MLPDDNTRQQNRENTGITQVFLHPSTIWSYLAQSEVEMWVQYLPDQCCSKQILDQGTLAPLDKSGGNLAQEEREATANQFMEA